MRVLNYIRGEFVDPESDFWMDNFSPSSGEVIGSIPLSGERDVDNAVMGCGGSASLEFSQAIGKSRMAGKNC